MKIYLWRKSLPKLPYENEQVVRNKNQKMPPTTAKSFLKIILWSNHFNCYEFEWTRHGNVRKVYWSWPFRWWKIKPWTKDSHRTNLHQELNRLQFTRDAIQNFGLRKKVESIHDEMMREMKDAWVKPFKSILPEGFLGTGSQHPSCC